LGLVRITVDVPERQHRNLRIAAYDRRVSVRQLVLDLLAREGISDAADD
jgi:predicted HicB family RNase H-like nuclease